MATLALQVSDGGKTFDRRDVPYVAFDGVDLELRDGEMLALLGPSGCGKSTLLRAIAGLEHLDRGRIHLGKHREPDHAVGIAFQQPSLLPWLTVRANVGLGLRFGANRQADAPGLVERTLNELGLAAVADSFPDELSGGQAQRANVARIIVTGRPILLLDEPFAALDPVTRSSLQDWLVDLQRVRGLSVIVVTHDVSEALKLGDRVALMTGAPGSIKQVWAVGDHADREAAARLQRVILGHYERDQSPEFPERRVWPSTPDTIEFEGATP